MQIQLRDYRAVAGRFDRVVSVGMVEHVGYKNYRAYMRAAARSLGEDGLFLCQGICGNSSRFHTDPWIERYIFGNSMSSLAQLTRAAESVFIVEDIKNIGPNYNPTLLAWEESSAAHGPVLQIATANVSGECGDFTCSVARHISARSLQVFSIFFSKEHTAGVNESRDQRPAASSSRTAVLEPSKRASR